MKKLLVTALVFVAVSLGGLGTARSAGDTDVYVVTHTGGAQSRIRVSAAWRLVLVAPPCNSQDCSSKDSTVVFFSNTSERVRFERVRSVRQVG